MESWDEQHRLWARAERALLLLRQFWGDQPPPGPHGDLVTLLDAFAGDDAHARLDQVVCQDDGLSYRAVAHLLHRAGGSAAPPGASRRRPAPGPPRTDGDAGEVVPRPLLSRLRAAGLLDDPRPPRPATPAPGRRPSVAAAPPAERPLASAAEPGPSRDERAVREPGLDLRRTGIWELDPASGIVAYDDVGAQLIGAGRTAGSARVDSHLSDLIHPDDSRAVATRLQQCLDSGSPFLMHFRARTAGGRAVPLLSGARVLHNPTDASPRLTGFITLDRDPSRPAADPVGHRP